MRKRREYRLITADDLSPRQIGLVVLMARSAYSIASQMVMPDPKDKPPEEAHTYISKIIGGMARHRLDYTALPEYMLDVGRLPKIHGSEPPGAKHDFPLQLGLMVARAGFEFGKPEPDVDPHEMDQHIVKECCAATAYYVADLHNVDIDPDAAFCGHVRQYVEAAFQNENPVAFLNTCKAAYTGPDIDHDEVLPKFEKTREMFAETRGIVAGLILARHFMEKGMGATQSLCDEAISITADHFSMIPHEGAERPRHVYRRRCPNPGRNADS